MSLVIVVLFCLLLLSSNLPILPSHDHEHDCLKSFLGDKGKLTDHCNDLEVKVLNASGIILVRPGEASMHLQNFCTLAVFLLEILIIREMSIFGSFHKIILMVQKTLNTFPFFGRKALSG